MKKLELKDLQGLIIRLKEYNQWRRGSKTIKMPDPKQLGRDLDTVIELLEWIDSLQ